jgi:hypothetical protein
MEDEKISLATYVYRLQGDGHVLDVVAWTLVQTLLNGKETYLVPISMLRCFAGLFPDKERSDRDKGKDYAALVQRVLVFKDYVRRDEQEREKEVWRVQHRLAVAQQQLKDQAARVESLQHAKAEKQIRLWFKGVVGKSIPIDVRENGTWEDAVQALAEKEGLKKEEIRVVGGGQCMYPERATDVVPWEAHDQQITMMIRFLRW